MTTKLWITGALLAGAISLVYAQAGYESPKAGEDKGAHERPAIKAYAGTGSLQVSKEYDKAFVESAIQNNLFGTKVFELVQKRSTNTEIKDYARRLQDDHKQSLEQLKAIAKSRNWDAPVKVEKWQQELFDRLSEKDPVDLDSCFLFEMAGLHYKEILEYKFVAKKSEDPEIKAFAARTIPTLQEHLQMTTKLTEQLAGVRPPYVSGSEKGSGMEKGDTEKGGIEKGGGTEMK